MKTKKFLFLTSLIIFVSGCYFPGGNTSTRPHTSTNTTSGTSQPTSSQTSKPTTSISTSSSTSESTSSSLSESTSASTSSSVPTSSSTSTSISTSEPTTSWTTYHPAPPSTFTSSTSITTTPPNTFSSTTSVAPTSSSTSQSGIDISAIPVNFTAINDFHGQLDEISEEYEVGIAKMASYLKERKAEGDVLISSGDNYQGSLICNITKGQWVSEVFRDIGFDALTIGNHEFDWGIDAIKANELVLGQKMLGANIYQYPQVNGEWVKSDVGDLYKIVTLNEGTDAEVKVGIIGVIGVDQLSSITSLFVKDIVFLDPTQIVKDLAVSLREDHGCDVVVASYHADDPDTSIADYVSGKSYRYVDACFMAHTHKYQYRTTNGVPFIQGSAYSRGVSSARFTYNKYDSSLTLTSAGYDYLNAMGLDEDPEVLSSLNDLKAVHASKFTDVIGRNDTGYEISTDDMARFYAKISYDKAIDQGYSVDACMFNWARQPLKAGDFTYSDLFETHPFLNDLYIISITAHDFANEGGSGYGLGYKRDGIVANWSDNTTRYNVLVFNYNGFHQVVNDDYSRYYNTFPSAFVNGAPEPIKLNYNCFEAALDWLEINHSITTSDFSGSNFM